MTWQARLAGEGYGWLPVDFDAADTSDGSCAGEIAATIFLKRLATTLDPYFACGSAFTVLVRSPEGQETRWDVHAEDSPTFVAQPARVVTWIPIPQPARLFKTSYMSVTEASTKEGQPPRLAFYALNDHLNQAQVELLVLRLGSWLEQRNYAKQAEQAKKARES